MSEQKILQKKSLGELFQKLRAVGNRILAPVRAGEQLGFEEVALPDKVALNHIQTTRSAKAAVFPRYEEMLRFKLVGKDVKVEELTPESKPTVLFGVHPCDAAGFATLKAVFTWDSGDAYFEPKLAQTTIIGLSCTKGDAYCFCTSVGGGPGDTRGSDILLTPIGSDQYLVEILTNKGQAVVALAPGLFTNANGRSEPERQRAGTEPERQRAGTEPERKRAGTEPERQRAGIDKSASLANIKPRFEAKTIAARLPALFPKTDVWLEQSLRCIGCGACAYVCPTCSCFDIQDERERYGGLRMRCWDSCGLGLFTLHASGHNPRAKQSERWRQRIMHKFSYQPERLGVLGCVGCGRCSRSCPVDMNLGEHVQALAEAKA